MNNSKFYIRARVTGGVTGTRVAYLKQLGEVVEFETYAEAEIAAAGLEKAANNNPNRKTEFSYEVVHPRSFEDMMEPLLTHLKQRRELDSEDASNGDYLGEVLNQVSRYIHNNWE